MISFIFIPNSGRVFCSNRYVWREQLRRDYGLQSKSVIGSVGRLANAKNQGFLLEVFVRSYRNRIDLELILLGAGELRESLEKQASEMGIAQSVHLLRMKTNVNEFYQMMDLFVLPSNYEGLGIGLIEAQTAGLKCLYSDYIPKDVNLTVNVSFLPLDVDRWINEIIEKSETYDRKDMTEIIIHEGYDLKTQIKEIEKMYLRNECVSVCGVKSEYNFVASAWIGVCA